MLPHPTCCQSQVSTWLNMRLSAADLQLINTLGINLHTGTQTTWWRHCRLRLADNAGEPGDHVEQKQIQINNLLETCQGDERYKACLVMQGRTKALQVLMMSVQSWSFEGAALDFLDYIYRRTSCYETSSASGVASLNTKVQDHEQHVEYFERLVEGVLKFLHSWAWIFSSGYYFRIDPSWVLPN